jgi:hypothetical protein
MDLENVFNKDNLVNFLEKWSHQIKQIPNFSDAGHLHERCEEIAEEMLSDSHHPLWEKIKNLPPNLI